jgi:pyruvate/2-oxoglutarate dehydrogenase complex dihydrolipoamide acyltransferase (E2) component
LPKNSIGCEAAKLTLANRWLSIPAKLLQLLRRPSAPGSQRSYPPLRTAILDIMAEGRRKNIINLLFEADLTLLRRQLAHMGQASGQRPSLTACILHAFVGTIDEDRSMQAYRLGATKLVVFDEVDAAIMIEREIDGHTMPVMHVVRAANRKGVDEIHREINAAKVAPLGEHGVMSKLEQRFFTLPAFLRRPVWFFIRRNPYLFKQLAGTVGVTSLGMHGAGSAVILPITPMTLTLSIGTIGAKVVLENGNPVEREIIRLNLGADHDLIDGAPLMRFAERFRMHLERGLPLPPS